MLKSHSITLSFSDSLNLSLSHSFCLYKLNNFCFYGYAQKSLSHLFHSLIHSLLTCWITFVFMAMLNSHSLSLSLEMLNNFCFYVYAQKSLSHSLNVSNSHSHTLSLTLDMLNNFYFHVYAQKSLSHTLSFTLSRHAEQLLFSCLCSKVTIYRWNWQWFFLNCSNTLPCEWTNHRAGSQHFWGMSEEFTDN